jgi:hypothetical protein
MLYLFLEITLLKLDLPDFEPFMVYSDFPIFWRLGHELISIFKQFV